MRRPTSKTAVSLTASALLVLGVFAAGPAGADPSTQRPVDSAATTAAGGYAPVTPALVYDSRPVHGVPAGGTRTFSATGGSTGVPTSGVAAVVLNVTVLAPAATGYLTVYGGSSRPASVGTLNFPAGRKLSNTAVVPIVGSGGLTIFNGATKAVDTVIVVTGWFNSGGDAPGSFVATGPRRIIDTSTTKPVAPTTAAGSVPANSYRTYQVAGAGGIPNSAGGVVVNVTAVAGTAAGYVTVAAGSTKPATNLVNLVPRQTLGDLDVVKLADDGTFSIFNSSATPVRVVVDLAGYLLGSTASAATELSPLPPAHIFSTIAGLGSPLSQIPAGGTRSITVAGRGGVPTSGVSAVALTLTAANAKAAGYLSAYPAASRPAYSTLAFPAGVTTPLTAIVSVSSGAVTVFNGSTAPVDVVADVSGFVRTTDLTAPTTSVSRYVDDLLSADPAKKITAKMSAHGCDDAVDILDPDARLTLLEFGAQSNKVPAAGGGTTVGVLPPATQGGNQRLTYAQVVTAVKGYISGFAGCRGESAAGVVTIGVGTSNDGYRFAPGAPVYQPADKGADWASQVVAPLVAFGAANDVTVVGADDIEPNFDGTAAEVKTWVSAFLGGNSLQLINNGGAPACPTTFGQINTTCQPVAPNGGGTAQQWSQSDYVAFSRGIAPTRISVAPQVYYDEDAVRWENISLTSAAAGTGPLTFAGVLTQDGVAVCGDFCGNTPAAGWNAMRQALDGSAVTTSSALPTVTNIEYDN